MESLTAYLEFARSTFDDYLEKVALPALRRQTVPELSRSMDYALSGGGKRLRPALLFLAAEVDQENIHDGSALPVAFALEAIHTYSLVHDDLPAMDNDDLRRGRPTCHVAFSEWEAILVGDALNTLAFATLVQIPLSAEVRLSLIEMLARTAGHQGMVAGQALDLYYEKNNLISDAGEDLLRSIHRQKTGALFAAATAMGSLLRSGPSGPVNDFFAAGMQMGLLFQWVDDLLDVTATSEALGKTPGKDARAGKLSAPLLLGLERAEEQARQDMQRLRTTLQSLPVSPRFLPLWQGLPSFLGNRLR